MGLSVTATFHMKRPHAPEKESTKIEKRMELNLLTQDIAVIFVRVG